MSQASPRPKSDTYAQFLRNFRIASFQRFEDMRLFQESLALRIRVLVQEEGFPLENEPDAHDENATHWVVHTAETFQVVATARIRRFEVAPQRDVLIDAHANAGKPSQPGPPNEAPLRFAILDKLAVLPDYRGGGTGRFLMVAMLTHIREQMQVNHIVALSHTRSVTFFENMGFIASRRFDDLLPPRSEGAIVMERVQ